MNVGDIARQLSGQRLVSDEQLCTHYFQRNADGSLYYPVIHHYERDRDGVMQRFETRSDSPIVIWTIYCLWDHQTGGQ